MNRPMIGGEAARLLVDAEAALIRCRDGAAAINLLARYLFDNGMESDTARNSIEWASSRLGEDIEAAADAIDRVSFDRAARAEVQPETQP